MEAQQPLELNLNVKRTHSQAEDPFEKEPSTANSLLSIDKLHISSRPVDLQLSNPSPALNQPDLKANNEAPEASPKTKCLYCDESFAKEQIAEHHENCEKRKILCEACGEMVMLDIFDFHLETCVNRAELNGYYDVANEEYFLQMGEGNVPEEEGNHQDWNPEENVEDQDAEPNSPSDDDEEDDFQPTYEQLIALDNTIVKKGMTEKELEQFPMDVHLKEIDGAVSCSVCISEVETGEIIRKLNCGHKFHRDCIDTWLNQNITCPVCKKYFR